MYNVVIINADNALNPSTKMCLIYTTIQKNTAIFQLRKFKTNLGIIERGDYIGIRSWEGGIWGMSPLAYPVRAKFVLNFRN